VSEKELLPIFEAQLGKPQNIEMIGKAIDKIEKFFREQGYGSTYFHHLSKR
jgi:outer membrane protein assembly factor BamA